MSAGEEALPRAATTENDDGRCRCLPCAAKAKTKHVRVWRWITCLDLAKPPGPVLRWAALLILGLCCWAAGIPLDIRDWLVPIIIAGALILPDVAGFAFAGIRLDLRRAQDEVATLRQDVNAQARATSSAGAAVNIGDQAIAVFAAAAARALSDQASGDARPWLPPSSGTRQAQKDKVPS